MSLIGKDFRYQYDAGAANETDLEDPRDILSLESSR